MEDNSINLNNNESKYVPQMGKGAPFAFGAKSSLKAIQDGYAGTAGFFAHEIISRLPNNKKYSLLDVGTSRGELLNELLVCLADYQFNTIGVDLDPVVLEENKIAGKKIIASATSLPFKDKSIDVLIARYIIQWNSPEEQKKILTEIRRVVNNFALIEHAGASDKNPDKWREMSNHLFSGVEIPKLKRVGHYFYSQSELENIMKELGVNFERINERRVDNYSDVFAVRYNLSKEEIQLTKEILGDYDYFIQTDWIIYPNK